MKDEQILDHYLRHLACGKEDDYNYIVIHKDKIRDSYGFQRYLAVYRFNKLNREILVALRIDKAVEFLSKLISR